MLISLDEAIAAKYPHIQIGFLIAKIQVEKSDPFVEELKQQLAPFLQGKNILATNFSIHPSIKVWKEIYEKDFQVSSTKFRSSLEALVRRVVTGKSMWNICNVVDLYNCCSVLSLLPIGGYDLNKISGNIRVRFARSNEPFLGLREKMLLYAQSNHIVYTDDEQILCYLWNYKDAEKTSIQSSTRDVIFFIDSVNVDQDYMKKAIDAMSQRLEKIGGQTLQYSVLDKDHLEAILR